MVRIFRMRFPFPTPPIAGNTVPLGKMTPDLQLDTKRGVLEALEAYHGIVSDACRKCSISRQTFYDWLKSDPEFKLAVEEIQDVAIDFVEGKLFERINGVEVLKGVDKETEEEITYTLPPDTQAINFYLRTKGRKRGYQEKTETGFTDSEGKDIQPTISINVIQPAPDK